MTLVFMVKLAASCFIAAVAMVGPVSWAERRSDLFWTIVFSIMLRAFQLATVIATIGCVWLA